MRTAQIIQDPAIQTNVLSSIAQAQATAGQLSEAAKNCEAAVRYAQEAPSPEGPLVDIAKAQATAGQFSEALRSAKQIENADARSSALTSLAEAQAMAHQWGTARNAVASCTGGCQLNAYTIILTEYAKANNPQIEQQLKEDKTGPGVLMKKK